MASRRPPEVSRLVFQCLRRGQWGPLARQSHIGPFLRRPILRRADAPPIRSIHGSGMLRAKKGRSRMAASTAATTAAAVYQTPRPAAASNASTTPTKQPRRFRFPFVWALIGTLFAATMAYSWERVRREDGKSAPVTLSANRDPSARYHQTAETFDGDVDGAERWSGTKRMRRQLAKKARGHVLEVSAGTGRNTDYYRPGQCQSVTFLDQAAEMTEVCRRKFEASSGNDFRKRRVVARFVTQDAMAPIDAPPGGFDTIVQTFGLCSTGDPVGLLRHLGESVKPDTGRILLLEHGRSIFGWLDRKLDRSAPAHAAQHGCWWNRDIGQIVRDSGLEIIKEKRYLLHAGTTYMYELRPAQQANE